MLKIPKKISVIISLVLTAVLMLLIIAGCVFAIPITDMLTELKTDMELSRNERIIMIVVEYLILASAAVIDVCLFLLLECVRQEKVFTERSVEYIRTISWLCIAIGAAFLLLGLWFILSYVVAFAAFFLGICLRVVKNVIEEATVIKRENDFTV